MAGDQPMASGTLCIFSVQSIPKIVLSSTAPRPSPATSTASAAIGTTLAATVSASAALAFGSIPSFVDLQCSSFELFAV